MTDAIISYAQTQVDQKSGKDEIEKILIPGNNSSEEVISVSIT
jgi:hypothetical protein